MSIETGLIKFEIERLELCVRILQKPKYIEKERERIKGLQKRIKEHETQLKIIS